MAPSSNADISVIIPTRNRAESLRQTLACLAAAAKGTLRCEVTVVINGGVDVATESVVSEFSRQIHVRHVFEPQAGKAHALNRAIADVPLGAIVAVLDDDMSPDPNWCLGVKAICDRWPDRDIFTGRSRIIWPSEHVPAWCRHPKIEGWAYSVLDPGPKDNPMKPGRWFSGNHFWFRSRVLASGVRFPVEGYDGGKHIEIGEARFQLLLADRGYRGMAGPDATCGHRLQPELLEYDVIERRAKRVGRGLALARLYPFKAGIKQGVLLRKHPLLGRLFCYASVAGWSLVRVLLPRWVNNPDCAARRLEAIERAATYLGYLEIMRRVPDYWIFGRGRARVSPGASVQLEGLGQDSSARGSQ